MSTHTRTLATLLALASFSLTHCATDAPSDVDLEDSGVREIEGGDQEDMGQTLRDAGAEDRDSGPSVEDSGLTASDMNPSVQDSGFEGDAGGGAKDMSGDMAQQEDMIDGEDMPTSEDMDQIQDMGTPPSNMCRKRGEGQSERTVVIGRPYGMDAAQTNDYEVLTLDAQGVLTSRNTLFSMGRAASGEILFTPDGEVGVARQEDGTIGIFSIDPVTGMVTVIDPAFAGLQARIDPTQERYFSAIEMASDGSGVFASNGSWRNVGGAVWFIPLDCATGQPGQEVLVSESKLPRELAMLPGHPNTLIVASHDILATTARDDVHLLDISMTSAPMLLDSARIFLDDDAIISAMTISRDGRYVLIGDSNISSQPNNNRVGVFAIQGQTLSPVQTLTALVDPTDIEVSPYHNAAIVTSFGSDSIVQLSYNPSQALMPFANLGAVTTTSATALPSDMVMIEHGALNGTVLVVENTGVRTLQFQPTGAVLELSNYPLGDGIEFIVGAIGVQP